MWPHYTYDEIFRCINAQYPAITSPTFLGPPLHLQINVEGQDVEGLGPKEQTKDLPNGATVELRYHRSLRVPVPNIEGVYEAGAAANAGAGAAARPNQLAVPGDNWRNGPWDEAWGGGKKPQSKRGKKKSKTKKSKTKISKTKKSKSKSKRNNRRSYKR